MRVSESEGAPRAPFAHVSLVVSVLTDRVSLWAFEALEEVVEFMNLRLKRCDGLFFCFDCVKFLLDDGFENFFCCGAHGVSQ